jgi:hypothetical protein
MATGPSGRGRVTLELGPLDELDLRFAHAPYLSVLALMKEVLANTPRGLPSAVARRIDLAVSDPGHAALDALADPLTMAPMCVFPGDGLMPQLSDSITALRDTTSDSIAESIAAEYGDEVPTTWRPPAREPRRWLGDFTRAAVEVARETVPERRRAQSAIDREIARGNRARSQDAVDVFLAELSPRLQLNQTTLSFADPQPEHLDLAGRQLVLVPMFAGPRILSTCFDRDDVVWIGYPVKGLFADEPAVPPDDHLVELLGLTRANLMLCIGRARSVGDLASILGVSPASVTFHCDRLVASGLIRRVRRGHQVQVVRTPRGDELVDLMCSSTGQ